MRAYNRLVWEQTLLWLPGVYGGVPYCQIGVSREEFACNLTLVNLLARPFSLASSYLPLWLVKKLILLPHPKFILTIPIDGTRGCFLFLFQGIIVHPL